MVRLSYKTFCDLMVGRIQHKESTLHEVHEFVELLKTNEGYWAPVAGRMSDMVVG